MKTSTQFLLFLLSLIGILIFVIIGTREDPKTKKTTKITKKIIDGIEIRVIDGCEYLVNRSFHGDIVCTHKGNCTNKIHYYKEDRK